MPLEQMMTRLSAMAPRPVVDPLLHVLS
jgi:hypothetical protein